MRALRKMQTILAAAPEEALSDAAGLAFLGLLGFSGFLLIGLL